MRYLHFRFYPVIYSVITMLVLELKFWTTRNDLKLVGFFANSFLSSFSFFQASFRIETWVSSQLQVSILDDVEARPCLLFRGHETNEYLVQKFIYSSARDWSSKICAKELYYIYFIWSKLAWGWVLGWEGFLNMTEVLKHKPWLTLLRLIT